MKPILSCLHLRRDGYNLRRATTRCIILSPLKKYVLSKSPSSPYSCTDNNADRVRPLQSEAYFKGYASDVTKMVKEYNGILKTRETTAKQGIAT